MVVTSNWEVILSEASANESETKTAWTDLKAKMACRFLSQQRLASSSVMNTWKIVVNGCNYTRLWTLNSMAYQVSHAQERTVIVWQQVHCPIELYLYLNPQY